MPTTADLLTTRLDDAIARRRHLDGQLVALRDFERRLTERVHAARAAGGQTEQVRELLARLLGVRSRLEEATVAQAKAAAEESRLRDDVRDADARLGRAQREIDERREFELACLRAPMLARSPATSLSASRWRSRHTPIGDV
ncbi:hypothetical protein [Actinomycetospora callitridis]|uniref:hypothetical protein n=1 Tax=Actinomycetospora callitridis TaxID=913944 RepID=UPI0023662B9C|nr:hypothetical protein [Actinomycetospora callitridis]MDD7917634.1 hypothetical protein [Actinomycetospora callitridis]